MRKKKKKKKRNEKANPAGGALDPNSAVSPVCCCCWVLVSLQSFFPLLYVVVVCEGGNDRLHTSRGQNVTKVVGEGVLVGQLSTSRGRVIGRSSASQGHGVDDLFQLAAEPLSARLLVLL